MKEREVEIKKVVLKIGKRELSFTIEEARKLFDVLGGLFKTKIIREEHHHYDWPYYRWYWSGTNEYITVDNTDGASFDTTTDSDVQFSYTSNTLTCSL